MEHAMEAKHDLWAPFAAQISVSEPHQREFNGNACPLILQCVSPDATLAGTAAWVAAREADLAAALHQHGAILFRGFPLKTATDFDQFICAFSEMDDLPYDQSLSFAVRVQVTGRVCTTNEGKSGGQAQTPLFPSKLFFFCEQRATEGGGTAICPSDEVLRRLRSAHPDFVRDCETKGVHYHAYLAAESDVSKGVGRSWKSFFGVADKLAAEERMTALGYTWEWLEGDVLNARSPSLMAVRTAPGALLVAQIANASEFASRAAGAAGSLDAFLRFDDGASVPRAALETARQFCDDTAIEIDWQNGDVALLDNYLGWIVLISALITWQQDIHATATAGARTWALVLTYIAFFVNMGASCAVVGPTLLLLGRQVHSTLGSLTVVNTARSLGFLFGTIFAGQVGDRAPHKRDQLISTAVLMMALATVLMAEQSNVVFLGIVSTVQACTAGIVDNLAQVLILSLEGIPVAPVMQAVHCGYGVGALSAPWIASFFLPDTVLAHPVVAARAVTTLRLSLAGTANVTSFRTTLPPLLAASDDDPGFAFTRFHKAYFIVAMLTLPTLVTHAAMLWCGGGAETDSAAAGSAKNKRKPSDSVVDEATAPLAAAGHQRLLLLMCVFLFLYVGCESGWGSYLATFAVKQRGFSVKDASLLTSAYWASFAAMRFAGIFISMRVDNDKMLNTSLAVSLVSLLVLTVVPSSSTVLWICCLTYGAGTATIYPCVITWLQVTAKVDGAMLAKVVGAACAGDALVPLVQGLTLTTEHAEYFVGVAFVFLVFATAAYVVARRTVPPTASALAD